MTENGPLIRAEPRPTDLVCPVCAEAVRRVRFSRVGSWFWACPMGHRAAREPITYAVWLASVGLDEDFPGPLQ